MAVTPDDLGVHCKSHGQANDGLDVLYAHDSSVDSFSHMNNNSMLLASCGSMAGRSPGGIG